jgi:hypothetical protein
VTLSRRQFLALPLAPFLALRFAGADPLVGSGASYHADIGLLFNLFTLTLDGLVDEQLDRIAGRYRVQVAGEGPGIANRVESAGVIRERRFTPTTTTLFFHLKGRESRTQISYDYEGGLVRYRHASQTFLLGRRRLADDVIALPASQPLDDVATATLNFAQNLLEVDEAGAYRTFVVRRARPEGEGPDEVQAGGYRAQIVPLRFAVVPEPEGGRLVARLDLTRWSSWARTGHDARITFGSDRRLEAIQASLMLGTTVRVTFRTRGDAPRAGETPGGEWGFGRSLPGANRVQSR